MFSREFAFQFFGMMGKYIFELNFLIKFYKLNFV